MSHPLEILDLEKNYNNKIAVNNNYVSYVHDYCTTTNDPFND